MKLKKFISESLTQIIYGIKEAQDATKDSGGEINPLVRETGDQLKELKQKDYKLRYIESIEFDIALTVNKHGSTEASIDVVAGVWAIKGKGEGKVSGKLGNESLHRVHFAVPIVFPQSMENDDSED